MSDFNQYPPAPRRSILPIAAVGAATFAIGAAGAFGFANWQANQRAAIRDLEVQLEQMQAMVTRAQTPDLTSVATIASAEGDLSEEDAAALAIDPSIQNREGLEDRIAAARALAGQIKLERLAEGEVVNRLQEEVLSGDYAVAADSLTDDTVGVVLVSEQHQNTAGLLADILAASANAGDIEVPDYIAVSDDGSVDANTLLFDLVQRSLQNGSEEEMLAAAELSRRAVEAFQTSAVTESVAETTAAGERFYTVESGDNLAYIALQFYGRTDAYRLIFDANADRLSDPDQIQIGQRLLIPEA